MGYRVELMRQAVKDLPRLKQAKLDGRAAEIIRVLRENPYMNPPPYEKLTGDLKGMYSRRINVKHRLIYTVLEEEKIVHVLRMWTHYE